MVEHIKRSGVVGSALAGLFTLGLMVAGPASATVDPGEQAISDFGSKVTTYGAAMIGVVVIGVGVMLAVRYISKAGNRA